MDLVEMKVAQRDVGESSTKKIRSDGKIPAIFYGRGIEPLPLSVDARTLKTIIHGEAGTNVILKLDIEGKGKGETAIIKEIQRHPIEDFFLHIDFLKIAMDEKIQAKVPVNLIGESMGVKEGGVLQHGLWEIEVEAFPKDLPDSIEVDVAELQIGDSVRVTDLTVSVDVSVLTESEETVASVVPPTELKEEELVEEEMLEPELIGAEGEEGEEERVEAGKEEEEVPKEETEEKEK